MNLWLLGRKDSQGSGDRHVHTAVFKMDNQHVPTAQHGELCSMLCGSLDGRGVWGRMDTCIYMAEFFPCSPETIITLLISYLCSLCYSVMSNSLQSHGLQLVRLLCPLDSPGKNTGVGCHALLQGIFPTQGSNLGLPHCRWILYHWNQQGSLLIGYIPKQNKMFLKNEYLNKED